MKKIYYVFFSVAILLLISLIAYNISYSEIVSGGSVTSRICPTGVSTHILNYETNGGGEIDSVSFCSACWHKDNNLPTPVREGYAFLGWYYDKELTKKVEATTIDDVEYTQLYDEYGCVRTTHVTIYAKWGEITIVEGGVVSKCPTGVSSHILNYETNGGSEIDSVSFCSACWHKDKSLPAPVREGYEFKGWYYDKELTKKVEATTIDDVEYIQLYYPSGCIKTTDVIIYAKWEKIEEKPEESPIVCSNDFSPYKIVYYTNGGNKVDSFTHCGSCTYKTAQNLPTPVREGYEFKGWYYDTKFKQKVNVKKATDITYTKNYDSQGCQIQATVKLYARWEKIKEEEIVDEPKCNVNIETLKIIYNTNGGEMIDSYIYCPSCGVEIEKIPEPVKEECEFVGWYYDAEFINKVETMDVTQLLYEQKYDDNNCPVLTEVNLYAKWNEKKKEENSNNFTVIYHTNGGNTILNDKVCIDCNEKTEYPIPVKEGFVFAGWYYDTEYEYGIGTKYLENLNYNKENIINLYAKWEIDTTLKDNNYFIKVILVIVGILILFIILFVIIRKNRKKKDDVEILGL